MWNPQGIYNQYILRTPVMLTGEESVRGLYNYPCARAAVIHGTSIDDRDIFKETFKKKEIRFFKRSWTGEPDLESLSGTLRELEAYKPDVIIAMGGGSVIDGVKLCRLFLEFPYFKPGTTRLDGKIFTTGFIAVPTTAGSGAEVSSAAVYVDTGNKSKQTAVMHGFQPDVVIYDERYVRNTPVRLLCASAMDAFAHIVEGYVSKVKNIMAETIAEEGLSILVHELKKLAAGLPEEIDFNKLLYAGQLGGIVQNHCIVGAAHAAAHQLAGFGFPHGEAVALLLPAVIGLNRTDSVSNIRYESIAQRAGFVNAEEMADFIHVICKMGGIESRRYKLKEILKTNKSNELFVQNIKNDRGGRGNPVIIDDGYINRLIDII